MIRGFIEAGSLTKDGQAMHFMICPFCSAVVLIAPGSGDAFLIAHEKMAHADGGQVSASKAKGTAAETAVVRFLQANGYPHAERRTLRGSLDAGDVTGILGLVIEIKNERGLHLAEWIGEAQAEAVNGYGRSGENDLPVVWHKRRGKGSPGDWYVTMDGWAFLALLERWTDA